MNTNLRPVENVALNRVRRTTIDSNVLDRWIALKAKSDRIIRMAEEKAYAEATHATQVAKDFDCFMLLAEQKWGPLCPADRRMIAEHIEDHLS